VSEANDLNQLLYGTCMEATMQTTYFIDYWLRLKFVAEYFEYCCINVEGSKQVYWHALAIDGAAHVCRYNMTNNWLAI